MDDNGYNNRGSGIFAVYDCHDGHFCYSALLKEILPTGFSEKPLWKVLADGNAITEEESERLEDIITGMAEREEPAVYYTEFEIKNGSGMPVCYSVGFISTVPQGKMTITFQELPGKHHAGEDEDVTGHDIISEDSMPYGGKSNEGKSNEGKSNEEKSNEGTGTVYGYNRVNDITGLMNQKAFLSRLEKELQEESCIPGKCAVVYFDIQRFKIINNMFGMVEGDRLLLYIADRMRDILDGRGFGCHVSADRFAFYICGGKEEVEQCIDKLFDEIAAFGLPFEVQCNAGIYMIEEKDIKADSIADCAIMAQNLVKGSYEKRYNYYKEEIREHLLGEQEITGIMRTALLEGQFVAYYQPQYNHSTGVLVGAEALVRWLHPEKGPIPLGLFIPVFENNGFITRMDLYILKRVCIFIRKCLDENIPVVPVSVNLTRYDIFSPGFFEKMEAIRNEYEVPSKYVRLEITESSALGNSQFINEAVRKLHSYGYIVEMDDFGSGYSSLNILKDIEFDMVKLDIKFLEKEKGRKGRGGTILSSIMRMMNWLQLPVIAEGVETPEQADFLQSIGCDYIQGYLYSRPLPEKEYEKLLRGSHIGNAAPNMRLIETMDVDNFWSNESLETLIFSNFVGGAGIFDYKDGKTEMLRVNKKYLQELSMNLSEKDLVGGDILDLIDESGKDTYIKMLEKAIETGEEQECESWRTMVSPGCGEQRICIRSTVRMIGRSKNNYIFYAMIRNITAEKNRYTEILDSERRFKAASEQVNIYYWEYTVATKEMRPCFRCMRDLGLPALLQNYPDSAIEMGVFPPEVADMYRDWHRQIAEGVPSLEAVMPLTVGRVPFHVRYTTEFDENGHPVKAYGSAALVVDEKK